MKAQSPAQAGLKGRKLTQWQENFARYIYQETGYVPDMQTLKLTLLLQKQYRASPWNKARLGKSENMPPELPELPFMVDEITVHIPKHHDLPKITSEERETRGKSTDEMVEELAQQVAVGPAWKYRAAEPFTTTFTPESQPDPAAMQKLESKIDSARKKAGRRKSV